MKDCYPGHTRNTTRSPMSILNVAPPSLLLMVADVVVDTRLRQHGAGVHVSTLLLLGFHGE